MTATAPPATTLAAAADTDGAPTVGFWRRNRVWCYVGIALAVALALSVWASQGDQEFSAPLDPQNPDPDGAQALAQVLGDEGVDVTIARNADELHDADVDRRTTVLVTGSEQLAPSTVERLQDDAAGAEIVLVDPPPYVVSEIQRDVEPAHASDETAGDCADDRFDGLELVVDTATSYDTDAGCFPRNGGFVLARGPGATTYLGAGQALSNDQVLRGDNAAVVLRLLGGHDRLVWYLPTYDDADDDEAVSLWSFAPSWLAPALWLTLVATIALIWWRGRRLGRLATEPLPVVVRAVETTRSRGRMYRRGDDRSYAGGALRAATRRRLADHLRLGRGASEAEVISAVARQLGRPEDEIGALLARNAPAPGSDHGLVRLAQQLTQLDREVRRG